MGVHFQCFLVFKGGNKEAKVVWKMAPHAIFWCLWRGRNRRTFEGVEKSIIDLKSGFTKDLFLWHLSNTKISKLSFVQFLDSLKI